MRGNVADDVHRAGLRVHLHLDPMTTPSICSREVPLEVLTKKFRVRFVEVGGHKHSVADWCEVGPAGYLGDGGVLVRVVFAHNGVFPEREVVAGNTQRARGGIQDLIYDQLMYRINIYEATRLKRKS